MCSGTFAPEPAPALANGKRAAAKFDLEEIRTGKVDDPQLLSGDVIVVPTSAMKEAFNNFVKVTPALNVFRVF